MTEGRAKLISELPTVNSVVNTDVLIVNANTGSSVNTSQISVANFIKSGVGNVASYSDYVTYSSGNNAVVANATANVAYFSYNRTIYAGAFLTIDMYSNSDSQRVFGTVTVTSNSTIANTGGNVVHIGAATVINPRKSANVSGNTVTIYLDGPTGNVQVRYLATLFKV